MFLQKGIYIWVHMRDLANHKACDIHELKTGFLKWATNDLCEPITKMFNCVAKEYFPIFMDYRLIHMIFKYRERRSQAI